MILDFFITFDETIKVCNTQKRCKLLKKDTKKSYKKDASSVSQLNQVVFELKKKKKIDCNAFWVKNSLYCI